MVCCPKMSDKRDEKVVIRRYLLSARQISLLEKAKISCKNSVSFSFLLRFEVGKAPYKINLLKIPRISPVAVF
jgi:hypothetical protein